MDIKSKSSNKDHIIGMIIAVVVIIVLAVSLTAFYYPIYHNSQPKLESYEKDSVDTRKDDFMKTLYQSNYALYLDLFRYQVDENILEPSNLFLKDLISTQNDSTYYDREEFCNRFNDLIDKWHQDFFSKTINNYPSFHYYIFNEETYNVKKNSNNIAKYGKILTKLKDTYPFYIVFKSGSDGFLSVTDYKGLEEKQINKFLSLQSNNQILKEEGSFSDLNLHDNRIGIPSYTTIIYASQSKNFYNNIQKHYSHSWDMEWIFVNSGFGYVCATALLGIILMALIIPLKKSWGVGNHYSTFIPFEINIAAMTLTVVFYINLISFALKSVSKGFIFDADYRLFSEKIQVILLNGVNILIWMAVLSIWYIGVLSVRQLFTLGPIHYFKNRSLIVRFLIWIYHKSKMVYDSLREIDLSSNINKTIMKLLAMNFIILALICCGWFFGIILLIPHLILIFVMLSKYANDIKKKYAILLASTSDIAGGNIEVTIEEDLGIFEPLKEELTKVQQGLIKAVEEETKSERMKTELITNFSHDLKTPLTAIITYIGLLKDDNISEGERKAYIDTLDMKSQRLKRLIEDLFEMSKASSNNITLNYEEVDLIHLIKQVLVELDDKIAYSDIEFRMNLPEQKVILSLDSEKTYRIFENLIINITKYAMPHTRAYIDMSLTEDSVSITIKNISATEMNFSSEEISERFVRGDLSRNTEGSGLGLAITKSFIELQGGKFSIIVDGDLFKVNIEWKIAHR